MSTPETTQKTKKQFSFAPRTARNDGSANSVIAGDRQRRSLRNIILIGVLVTSGAIASTLILTGEEEIKVQVESKPEEIKQDTGGLELKGLSFKGITADGNDFIVLAETAIESTDNPEIVTMTSPRARVDTDDGNPMTMRSLNGAFNRNEDRVNLEGRVVIVRPDIGYTLMTDTAIAYLNSGKMVSDQEVRGFSPRARVRADGMVISENGDNVLFTGKSTLRILTQQSN